MVNKFLGIGGTDGTNARPVRTNQKGELLTQISGGESVVVINRVLIRDNDYHTITLPENIKKFPYFDIEIRNSLDSDVGIAFLNEQLGSYRMYMADGSMRQYDADVTLGRVTHIVKAKTPIINLSNIPTFVGEDIIEPIGGFNSWQNFDKDNLHIYYKAKTIPTSGDLNIRIIGVNSK